MTIMQLKAMNFEQWQGVGIITESEPLMKRLKICQEIGKR